MKVKYIVLVVVVFLSGCGQSALDECADSKGYLWNTDIDDNRYKGNERYWNAIKECENKHG